MVLLEHGHSDFAHNLARFGRRSFHKSICPSGEAALAIMAETEAATAAFVSTCSPCSLNCAVAGF